MSAASHARRQRRLARMADGYRSKLKQFFVTPDLTVDKHSLADFLEYKQGHEKAPSSVEGSGEDRLKHLLGTVKFKRIRGLEEYQSAPPRPVHPEALNHDVKLLNQLLVQSDHQNKVTSKFLALLSQS